MILIDSSLLYTDICSVVDSWNTQDTKLKAAFIEIYNENIHDHLKEKDSTDKELRIKETLEKGTFVQVSDDSMLILIPL